MSEALRRSLVPISYICGGVAVPRAVDGSRQLSGVPLQRRDVTVPGGTLMVLGHPRAGQSLDAHIWSDGLSALVFCGDIYNIEQLMSAATPVIGRRRVESVAHLMALLLEHCPERFLALANGKFAIARTGPAGLQLIRDRIGEEQLYHARTGNGGTAFASSVRVLADAVPGSTFQVPDSVRVFETPIGPETMFSGIRKVESGAQVRIGPDGRERHERYWEIVATPPLHRSDADYVTELRDVLGQALVRRRALVDGASAYLSGGQDSSWVSCALAADGRPPVRVYTTAFRDLDSVYDESRHAGLVARHVGAEHVVLAPTAEDFVNHFPATMAIFDEVKANAAHFAEYWIARAAAERSDHTLYSGYGADEALGGEVRYLVMYLDRNRERSRDLFSRHPLLANYRPLFEKVGQCSATAREAEKYFHLMRRGGSQQAADACRVRVEAHFGRAEQLIDQMGLVDIEITAQPLLDSAKVNKYWGIDKVCPFLDPDFIAFAFSLPEHLKVSGLTTKSVLRMASRGLVPDRITDRSDKVGFAFPHNEPRYRLYLTDLAAALTRRTGRVTQVDDSRGRFDRALLMAASEELIHRSLGNGSH